MGHSEASCGIASLFGRRLGTILWCVILSALRHDGGKEEVGKKGTRVNHDEESSWCSKVNQIDLG